MSKKLAHDAIKLLNALEVAGYDFYGKGRNNDIYINFCKQYDLYDLAVSISRRFRDLGNITPEVIKMYINGESPNYIAKSFQVSTRTISKIIKENGLQERLRKSRYNHTKEMLRRCNGNYTVAGKLLGITPTAVHKRLEEEK